MSLQQRVVRVFKPVLFMMALVTLLLYVYDRFVPYSIGWNTTASIPTGLYFAENYHGQAPKRGELLCFRYEVPTWAKGRGYAAPGQRFCKPVAGLPGDVLTQEGTRLTVAHSDGTSHSYQLRPQDSKGRELPQDALPSGPIAAGSYLLISDYKPNSLDSRYLGLIAQSRFTDQVWPLWVHD